MTLFGAIAQQKLYIEGIFVYLAISVVMFPKVPISALPGHIESRETNIAIYINSIIKVKYKL